MTRIEYASLGSPDADGTVVVLREGALATTDPDVTVTRTRDVRLVAVRVDDAEVAEPGAYGGETPAAVTVKALVELMDDVAAEGRFGLVGVGGAGEVAVHLAAVLADRVDRLALVAVPEPEGPLDREEEQRTLAGVSAQTLILVGEHDPDAAAAAAEWHRARLPSARVEIVPPPSEGADARLALGVVWERVLAHTAPGTQARPGRGHSM